jgi:PAS domain-containing protein
VVTDITARLEMEQALRASEARLAAFMQHAPTLATPQPSGWRPVKPHSTGFLLNIHAPHPPPGPSGGH